MLSQQILKDYQIQFLYISQTVAHEIGHNLGMNHDHADVHKHKCKGKGLMSYGDHPNVWSSCSVADFNAHYTANKVRWCMPESSSACGGGGYSGCKSFESKPTAPSSSSCSWWQWWCQAKRIQHQIKVENKLLMLIKSFYLLKIWMTGFFCIVLSLIQLHIVLFE